MAIPNSTVLESAKLRPPRPRSAASDTLGTRTGSAADLVALRPRACQQWPDCSFGVEGEPEESCVNEVLGPNLYRHGNSVVSALQIRDAFGSPEEIDDSPATVPSQRVRDLVRARGREADLLAKSGPGLKSGWMRFVQPDPNFHG